MRSGRRGWGLEHGLYVVVHCQVRRFCAGVGHQARRALDVFAADGEESRRVRGMRPLTKRWALAGVVVISVRVVYMQMRLRICETGRASVYASLSFLSASRECISCLAFLLASWPTRAPRVAPCLSSLYAPLLITNNILYEV